MPPTAISRVIGRGGSNINTIRGVTGAHIEVDKQTKSQGERIITIKYAFIEITPSYVKVTRIMYYFFTLVFFAEDQATPRSKPTA